MEWEEKAAKNVEKWGNQDKETLVMAMMEELGELTQAVLQYNQSIDENIECKELQDDRYQHIKDELNDLAPLMYQLKAVL